jgi:hypothetical protein
LICISRFTLLLLAPLLPDLGALFDSKKSLIDRVRCDFRQVFCGSSLGACIYHSSLVGGGIRKYSALDLVYMYHHRQCMQLMHARLVSHQHAADRSRQYPKIQKTPIELGSKCMWGALRGSRLLSATLAPAQQHAIRRTAHQLPLFLFHPFTCLCRAYAPASTHGVSTCHRNGSSRRCVTLIAGRGCRPAGKGEQPLLFVQNNLGRGAGGDAHEYRSE